VPGFGDDDPWLFIVGLAPAAHGANRTGRMFTGDRSADFLMAALHRAGLANQPGSVSRDDGLRLTGAWVTVAVRCAPPANKPTPDERARCMPFLQRELAVLTGARVIVCLGAFALQAVAELFAVSPRPKFAHGAVLEIGGYSIVCSYHPSQQNTFTGTLTEPMLDAVFSEALRLAN
jgi:uracil-DNA glycosylase family 4